MIPGKPIDFLIITFIPLLFAIIVYVLMFLLKNTQKQNKELINTMRDSFEKQIYAMNKQLELSMDRWEDVNHLLLSSQNAQPLTPQLNQVHFSQFLKANGIEPEEIEVDPKLVFVLSPFNNLFNDVFNEIRKTCLDVGFQCYRGDEEFLKSGDILRHLLKLLCKASIVIVNIEGRNPNVFYELGLAHAMDKNTILISKTIEAIPIDLKSKRFIIYQNLNELSLKLKDELLKFFNYELTQKGLRPSTEDAAFRYEDLIRSPKSDIELIQAIEKERAKILQYTKSILKKVNDTSYESLWDGFIDVFHFSYNYFMLSEQIVKYRNEYWGEIIKIFESIVSLNVHGNEDGKNGLVNYLFYCILETIGAITVNHQKFRLLRQLLEIKRLSSNKSVMENILSWYRSPRFIEIKNIEESKKGNSKWLVPQFHYLLQMVASDDFPLKFEVKNRLIETDLLFFVYTVSKPEASFSRYWFPCSPVYSEYVAPDLFKRIKIDQDFGKTVAVELFDLDYQKLLQVLAKAKQIISKDFQRYYFPSDGESALEDF